MKEERRSYEYTGGGWHFQADEVARCLRNGKRESGLWGHDKSLLQMEIFDEVIPLLVRVKHDIEVIIGSSSGWLFAALRC